MSDYFGKEVPKLGFGLMRLPKKGLHTDVEQVKHMVDLFMEARFTYFDTAYVYLGSEAAIKKALVDRYPLYIGDKTKCNDDGTDGKDCKKPVLYKP